MKVWRRRTILIATLIVALSVSIIFVGVPYLPKPTPPHNSITSPLRQSVPAATQNAPGSTYVLLPLTVVETFTVNVNVTGGQAGFCVIKEPGYQDWQSQSGHAWATLQPSCLLQETTAKDTLSFTPPSTGNWDVAIVNSNPTGEIVYFTPA